MCSLIKSVCFGFDYGVLIIVLAVLQLISLIVEWPHTQGCYPIIDKFKDTDITDITSRLPSLLYNRTIPSIVTDTYTTESSVYLYSSKFTGKSVEGKLIAIYFAQNNIPFIYVEADRYDHDIYTCERFALKFGYYATGKIVNILKYINTQAGNPSSRFDQKCKKNYVFHGLREAGESFVKDNLFDILYVYTQA